MALRSDQGIVLRGYSFGEADRIIVLISPNNGKIRTVAKGVRKTKSRFGGRLEPSHTSILCCTKVATLTRSPRLR